MAGVQNGIRHYNGKSITLVSNPIINKSKEMLIAISAGVPDLLLSLEEETVNVLHRCAAQARSCIFTIWRK
jgi:hypothetical protein